MNEKNQITRRRALGLVSAALVPFTILKAERKADALSASEAFRIIDDWNGGALSTREIEILYLAVWPTLHRHGYNIFKIPSGRKVRQFFDREKMEKLLRVVASGDASDLLYIALESPLRLTYHGVVGGPEWSYYVAWLKYSLVPRGEMWSGIRIAWEAIYLSEILRSLPKP